MNPYMASPSPYTVDFQYAVEFREVQGSSGSVLRPLVTVRLDAELGYRKDELIFMEKWLT